MNHNINHSINRINQSRGFGLIELMISMMLGLILLLGVSGYFISSKQTNTSNVELNKLADISKLIAGRLSQEIRMSGYYGVMKIMPDNLLNNKTTLAFSYSNAVSGYNNIATPLAAALSSHLTGDPSPALGSDVLILRTTFDVPPVAVTADTNATSITVSAANSTTRVCDSGSAVSGICDNDIALISDYTKSKIFQITSISSGGVITHTNEATDIPGNATSNWNTSELSFTSNAEVIPYQTLTYYIANHNGLMGLYRKVNNDTAQLFIPGVQNLQVTYGVDTNSDQSVDNYVTANNVSNWDNVISIRVAMLISSESDHVSTSHQTLPAPYLVDASTIANDFRIYKPLVFTATLRNRIK